MHALWHKQHLQQRQQQAQAAAAAAEQQCYDLSSATCQTAFDH
jgi:hypothetical protein